MDKQIYDVKIRGNGVIQVDAESFDEAKKLGLVAYRKTSGVNGCLDFHKADDIIEDVSLSKKVSMQYV